jgi:hypothetical protein
MLKSYENSKDIQKRIDGFAKNLKNKSIFLYGAGSFFEKIYPELDFSALNIIGISDKRYEKHKENEKFLGFTVYSLSEMIDLKPDYIIVTTKFYIDIIDDFFFNIFKNSKTKVRPLIKKSLLTLLHEVIK